MSLLFATDRTAAANSFHPTLNQAVNAARAANIPIVTFPALLRFDQLDASPIGFFRDIANAQLRRCDTCVAANRKCVLHNGSSYRCLACWVGGARGCSHQDCEYAHILRGD